MKKENNNINKSKKVINQDESEKYYTCNGHTSIYVDTESSDFGYWDVCSDCNKKIEDGFHYYNHYDGEDHDDIDLYCDNNF